MAETTSPAPRRNRLMRGMLLFAVGLLAGANLLYYAMTRDTPPVTYPKQSPRAAAPPPQAAATGTVPAAPAPAPLPAMTPTPATPTRVPAGVDPTRSVMRVAGPSGLLIPVDGIQAGTLLDTFNDARGQSRVHDAIDIMAPRGTPVRAVADGTVEKLFTSDAGGLTIYQFEPTGRYAYYYAHLDRYAPGLAEGDTLRQGQLVGYVGSTGNASDDAPHLHFAIFLLGPEKRWWEGTAINPYPLLGGR